MRECDAAMTMAAPDVETMQRWLQSTLVELSEAPISRDRDVRMRECELAIQACIRFRAEWAAREEEGVRMTEEATAARVIATAPTEVVGSEGECRHCEAPMSADLDFCASCGEYP